MCGCQPSDENVKPEGEGTGKEGQRSLAGGEKPASGQGSSEPANEFCRKPAKKPTAPENPPKPAVNPEAASRTEMAKAVFEEQNAARTNPKAYASKLEKYLGYFKGSTMFFPGNPVGLMTNEGPASYKEAIAFLKAQAPMTPLKWSAGLAKAAADHVADMGAKGFTGHTGSDGSSMTDRMKRYGEWQSNCGENCAFGSSTAEEIVCQLIVDDGVSTRGHRKNIFSPDFGVTGIAFGPHKGMDNCCVFDYAKTYNDK
jgi:uncharacterized protein YkwD